MKVRRYSCPQCRTLLEAIPDDGLGPEPGAVLLCCACLAVHAVTHGHALTPLTLADYDRLPPEEQVEIRVARQEALWEQARPRRD